MDHLTAVSFAANDVTADETALRQTLHTALETAVETYMRESKLQDIIGIEMFPCPVECAECAECVEAA